MYEVFEQLLQMRGITAYRVAKETGIAQSVISSWKSKRHLLSGKNAQKIADYFNVPVDYLMTGKMPDESYYTDPESAMIAQQIRDNPELKAMFDAASDIKPDQLNKVTELLLSFKRTNPDG